MPSSRLSRLPLGNLAVGTADALEQDLALATGGLPRLLLQTVFVGRRRRGAHPAHRGWHRHAAAFAGLAARPGSAGGRAGRRNRHAHQGGHPRRAVHPGARRPDPAAAHRRANQPLGRARRRARRPCRCGQHQWASMAGHSCAASYRGRCSSLVSWPGPTRLWRCCARSCWGRWSGMRCGSRSGRRRHGLRARRSRGSWSTLGRRCRRWNWSMNTRRGRGSIGV
jgi:hypothetical protein